MQEPTRACERCGSGIVRTGRRGRAAKWCRPCAAIVLAEGNNPHRKCPMWAPHQASRRRKRVPDWVSVVVGQIDERCAFPGHRAATGYKCGCRCDRCRDGWRLAAQIRRHGGAPVRFCLNPTCGDPLPTSRPKYCSDKCRGYHRVEPRVFTCDMVACHNLCASSHRDARYCSESCSRVAKKARRRGAPETLTHPPHWLESQPVAGPTLAECDVMSSPVFGPTLTDWPMFRPTAAPTFSACASCDRLFTGRHSPYCSQICQRIDNGKCPRRFDLSLGHCRRCGRAYARWVKHDPNGFCSPKCNTAAVRKERNGNRRAARRGGSSERFTLREIAERDGWRCHLCGGKVPDRKYAARDKDPTIDHLIPVSAGGDDIRSNVALAHNRCNWERGNQGLAQLRLVG